MVFRGEESSVRVLVVELQRVFRAIQLSLDWLGVFMLISCFGASRDERASDLEFGFVAEKGFSGFVEVESLLDSVVRLLSLNPVF